MTGLTIDDLLRLERGVWEALAHGDAAADARLLSDDFLGVYETGFAGRDDHVAQLHDGPTVTSYSLHEARMLELSGSAVLLAYRAQYDRVASTGGPEPAAMYVSSLWCRRDGRWVNVFSQDTPIDER